MSISRIKEVFNNLSSIKNVSFELIKYNINDETGIYYNARELRFKQQKEKEKFLSQIQDYYVKGKESIEKNYKETREYDGTNNNDVIYKLSVKDNLVQEQFNKLKQSISNPDAESNIYDFTSAYLFYGDIEINNNSSRVIFISVKTPFSSFKNKFFYDNGEIAEYQEKILTLKNSIEILIFDNFIYFISLNGEKFFDMERTYKKICSERIEEVMESGTISDNQTFKITAEKGHYPRYFLSFNKKRLELLSEAEGRKKIASKFSIELSKDGKIDTTKIENAEKIIKLLCNKGMFDPFEEIAVEVDGARNWK